MFVLGGSFLPMPLANMADSYVVTARIPAPLPSSAAVITSPPDQSHFTNPLITVSGTCPADSAYVRIDRGVTPVGYAACQSGSFSLQITLAAGANTLTAHVFNSTDDEGPASNSVTVYYDPPVPDTLEPQPGGTPSPKPPRPLPAGKGGPALYLHIPYRYTVRAAPEIWLWEVTVGGGATPYVFDVEWGDGQTDHFVQAVTGQFSLGHTYTRPGSYQPLVRVTDAAGTVEVFQLVAVVRETSQFGMGISLPSIDPWIGWTAYVTILALICIFWAYEIRHLHRHVTHRRRLRHGHV